LLIVQVKRLNKQQRLEVGNKQVWVTFPDGNQQACEC
jgi:hypothetical protein